MAITTMGWQSASESLSSEILRSNHRNRPRLRFIRFQRFLGQQRDQFSCGQFSTETPKLANGNGHGAPIGPSTSPAQQDQMSTVRSAGKSAVRERTASRKAKLARSLLKKTGSESTSNRLVCRYRGSEDLAPSFIKRRDRRCRKCFSKRYGSAAREWKAKAKK
jgi:hypothetical protein